MTGATAIGALRHRVVIEQPVHGDDGGGGTPTTWTPLATVWAAITPAGSAERDIGGRLDGVVTHRVTMRHRSDVLGGMRLVKDGRTYRVLVVHDPDERRRWTECLVEEEEP